MTNENAAVVLRRLATEAPDGIDIPIEMQDSAMLAGAAALEAQARQQDEIDALNSRLRTLAGENHAMRERIKLLEAQAQREGEIQRLREAARACIAELDALVPKLPYDMGGADVDTACDILRAALSPAGKERA